GTHAHRRHGARQIVARLEVRTPRHHTSSDGRPPARALVRHLARRSASSRGVWAMSDADARLSGSEPLVVTGASVTAPGFASAPVSAKVEKGGLFLVTGPIGSGKSVLAEALAGVKRPNVTFSGSLRLGERSVSATQKAIVLVPEDFRLA